MNKRLIFLWIAGLTCICANAQETGSFPYDSLSRDISETRLTGDLFLYQSSSKVSQYFIDEWLDGTLRLSNHMVVSHKKLRYNGYLDRVIWINGNFQQVKLDRELVDGFTLYEPASSRTYTFEKIRISEDLKPDSFTIYAQVLYKGRLSLYAWRKVAFTGSEQVLGTRYMINSYEKRTYYYFCSGDSTSRGFRHLNRRNILKAFPEKRAQLLALMRSSKQRSFKTEEDLIRFTRMTDESQIDPLH